MTPGEAYREATEGSSVLLHVQAYGHAPRPHAFTVEELRAGEIWLRNERDMRLAWRGRGRFITFDGPGNDGNFTGRTDTVVGEAAII